jgi:ABC-type uncharacterized transport system substrate-binding protein
VVELRPKTLELIRELVPNAATIAVLVNPNRPNFQSLLGEVLEPARRLGLQVHVLKAGNEGEIDAAFSTFRNGAALSSATRNPRWHMEVPRGTVSELSVGIGTTTILPR